MKIDSIAFFRALQAEMNADPERLRVIGEADMTFAIVMHDGARRFGARIRFEDLSCVAVTAAAPGDEVDFSLVGPIDAWQAMFDNILADGHATGLRTINSLVLLGDEIGLVGDDPMGLDKFSRFNQTLQEYFDGAASVAVPSA